MKNMNNYSQPSIFLVPSCQEKTFVANEIVRSGGLNCSKELPWMKLYFDVAIGFCF
jgi:hypothetical protein